MTAPPVDARAACLRALEAALAGGPPDGGAVAPAILVDAVSRAPRRPRA
jgi:hypothetical protein